MTKRQDNKQDYKQLAKTKSTNIKTLKTSSFIKESWNFFHDRIILTRRKGCKKKQLRVCISCIKLTMQKTSLSMRVFHAFSIILQLCGAWCTMSILIILEYRCTVLFYFIKYGRRKLCSFPNTMYQTPGKWMQKMLARSAVLYETNMSTSNFTNLQLPVTPVDRYKDKKYGWVHVQCSRDRPCKR